MGHLEFLPPRSGLAWTADLGKGGGYRRKILARPVVVDGVVVACAWTPTPTSPRRSP